MSQKSQDRVFDFLYTQTCPSNNIIIIDDIENFVQAKTVTSLITQHVGDTLFTYFFCFRPPKARSWGRRQFFAQNS